MESTSQPPNQWTFTIRTERDAALEETLIYDAFWVLRVKDHFPRLSLKGVEKNGDSQVHVIEATPVEGRTRILFFDVAQGLLTRAGAAIAKDALPGADQILDKHLAAIGGSPALSRFKTQLRKGVLKEDAESVPLETAAKAPGKWLLTLHTSTVAPHPGL